MRPYAGAVPGKGVLRGEGAGMLVGLSHRTAGLELRERLAIPSGELPAALSSLRTDFNIPEVAILSTCHRVEFYVSSSNHSATFQRVLDFLAFRSRLAPSAFQACLYRLEDRELVVHLFRVAAGLDSMILGESEITAQVKQAYLTALSQGATGPVLNRLFQKALHCAKVIRSTTCIAHGQASIGSLVVQLARTRFGDRLKRCNVLLWGAGKAAEVTARHLINAGVGQLWIVSRTQAKAQDLAALCQGGWLSWEQAVRHLAHVDLAIVCTQAPHYVIDEADVAAILPQRGSRTLLIIDLAVPRNVDPAIRTRPGIQLYNIDDLQAITQENMAARKQELPRCEAIIQEQVDRLLRWQGVYRKLWKEGQDALEQRLVASIAGW